MSSSSPVKLNLMPQTALHVLQVLEGPYSAAERCAALEALFWLQVRPALQAHDHHPVWLAEFVQIICSHVCKRTAGCFEQASLKTTCSLQSNSSSERQRQVYHCRLQVNSPQPMVSPSALLRHVSSTSQGAAAATSQGQPWPQDIMQALLAVILKARP